MATDLGNLKPGNAEKTGMVTVFAFPGFSLGGPPKAAIAGLPFWGGKTKLSY